jgi:hypothetical protein
MRQGFAHIERDDLWIGKDLFEVIEWTARHVLCPEELEPFGARPRLERSGELSAQCIVVLDAPLPSAKSFIRGQCLTADRH